MERLLSLLEIQHLSDLNPLALESVLSPATRLLSLEYKGEGEPNTAPNPWQAPY